MSPTLLYRIAAGLLVFYAVSHTVGLLRPRKAAGFTEVWEAMHRTRFRFMGSDLTWGGMYVGFGLMLTANLLFTAWMAWQLGAMAQAAQPIGPLGWGLAAVQLVNALLCLRYFFAAPTIVSSLATLVLATAAWMAGA